MSCRGKSAASSANDATSLPCTRTSGTDWRLRRTPTGYRPALFDSYAEQNTTQSSFSFWMTDLNRRVRNERPRPRTWIDSSSDVFPLPLSPKKILRLSRSRRRTVSRLRTPLISRRSICTDLQAAVEASARHEYETYLAMRGCGYSTAALASQHTPSRWR